MKQIYKASTLTKDELKKTCIWCNSEIINNNRKKSHTIPKSIGGKDLYDAECNDCNSYFGNNIKNKDYSLESAFTNALGFIKYKLLKNPKPHVKLPSSSFFNYTNKNGRFHVEYKNYLKKSKFESFQFFEDFKKSFFKIFISEFYSKHKELYNEIDIEFYKRFCRYEEGSVKLFIWEKPWIFFVSDQRIQLENMNYLHIEFDHYYSDDNIFEFEYLGFVFIMQKKQLSDKELYSSLLKSVEHKNIINNFIFMDSKIIEMKSAAVFKNLINN